MPTLKSSKNRWFYFVAIKGNSKDYVNPCAAKTVLSYGIYIFTHSVSSHSSFYQGECRFYTAWCVNTMGVRVAGSVAWVRQPGHAGWQSSTLILPVILFNFTRTHQLSEWELILRVKICKRCSFECDMGKYSTRRSTRQMNLILSTYAVFQYFTKNWQRLYFFTQSRHTWHICHRPTLKFKLQQKCDMYWYQYTSHREKHCT